MSKKIGLVIILLMFAYLANSTNTQTETKINHLNQPKGEDMMVINTVDQPKTT